MLRGLLVIIGLWPIFLVAGEEPEPLPEIVTMAPVVETASSMEAVKPPAVSQLANLNSYVAKYEVKYNGLKVGELVQQLTEKSTGSLALQTVAKTTGVVALLKSDKVVELSLWLEQAGDLLPVSYTYHYSGRSKDIFERQDFDWVTGKVKSLHDAKVTELSVAKGTYDKHMYQVALRYALLNGKKKISYPVAERAEIKQYEFEVLAEELVETRHFGKLKCLKVKKGTTRIWVAEKFDYLPIKIEKDEDGTTMGTYLVELTGG